MVKRLVHKAAAWVARKTHTPVRGPVVINADLTAFKKAMEDQRRFKDELDRIFPHLTGDIND